MGDQSSGAGAGKGVKGAVYYNPKKKYKETPAKKATPAVKAGVTAATARRNASPAFAVSGKNKGGTAAGRNAGAVVRPSVKSKIVRTPKAKPAPVKKIVRKAK